MNMMHYLDIMVTESIADICYRLRRLYYRPHHLGTVRTFDCNYYRNIHLHILEYQIKQCGYVRRIVIYS